MPEEDARDPVLLSARRPVLFASVCLTDVKISFFRAEGMKGRTREEECLSHYRVKIYIACSVCLPEERIPVAAEGSLKRS